MEQEVERAGNLVWIERIIRANLEIVHPELENNGAAEEPPTDLTVVSTNSETNKGQPQQERNANFAIAEIDMRDENYFGDERIHTLSRILAARIKYVVEGDEEERSHFWIIKLPATLAQERQISKEFNVHLREICFYTEILPALKLWVESQYIDHLIEFKTATCYYGKFLRSIDPSPDVRLIDHISEAESLLVLEDLRAAEFGKRHFGKGMEISEVFAAITEICKFHAVSYAMQQKTKEPLSWKELFHWKDFVHMYEGLFRRGYALFENYLSNYPDEPEAPQMLQTISKLNANAREVLAGLMKPTEAFPVTLVHMDLWSENLLFRVKDEDMEIPLEEADLDCVIMDWQLVGLGNPTHDLGLLTVLSMDAEVRREYAHLILQYYYQLFEQILGWFELEMPFSYDTLIIEYSNSCLLALMMAMGSMDIVLMEDSTQNRLLDVIKDLMEDGLLP